MLKFFVFGFIVKLITGLDDSLTHVPVMANITRTRMGKVAFSIGILSAIITAIFIAFFFSAVIGNFPYYRYIVSGLIFVLAAAIYFDILIHKPRIKAEKLLMKQISAARFSKLAGIGFIAAFATVLDDIIAYMPLLHDNVAFTTMGILAAAILEIILIVYFAGRIAKLKYKKEISSIGLVLLAILILAGVI